MSPSSSPVGTSESWRAKISRPYGTGREGLGPFVPSDESLVDHQKSLRDRIPGNSASHDMKMWAKTSSWDSGYSRVGQASLERCSILGRRLVTSFAVPGDLALRARFTGLLRRR